MKKSIYLSLILSLFIGFSSCEDDGDDKPSTSSSSSNNTTTNANISGVYNGRLFIVNTNKTTNAKDTTDTTFEVTISGSGTSFTMTEDDNGTISSVGLTVSGNSFSGSNGTNNFENTTFSGTISGDNINVNISGEDTDATWSGSYTASRPPNTGGGSGNQLLQVDGQSYTRTRGTMDCPTVRAVFETSNDSIVYYLDIEPQGNNINEMTDLNPGTYKIIAYDSFSSNDDEFKVYLLKDKALVGNLENWSASANQTFTISNNNGKWTFSGNNISLIDRDVPGASNSMNFSISCD